MCGIFGVITANDISLSDILPLAQCAEQRGRDSSGILYQEAGSYHVQKGDVPITRLLKSWKRDTPTPSGVVMGHSRLITNGLADNQPVLRDGIAVLHNGIIVNNDALWEDISKTRQFQVDTEIIGALAAEHLERGGSLEDLPEAAMANCHGVIACAIAIPRLGKLCLFSNNGSLYVGEKGDSICFSSEKFPLEQIDCTNIRQVMREAVILDIPVSEDEFEVTESATRTQNLIPELILNAKEEELLLCPEPDFTRCTKCLLPETMPFIEFDDGGVCNYCATYRTRNKPKPKEELFKLVEPYRRATGNECIVPFSGGRDSCYGLHLIVNELKMRPLTYTYDWGMITDLGRRNISRMCGEMGVENIIVAADITKKRENITKNLKAWLKSPHLGMISILTAGDKHFFQHVETIKKQTGISLNLWGVNPLEVTHFKAGFLGIPPNFGNNKVYSSGAMQQLQYQSLRFKAMLKSPGYFNSSLWDTLTGEYHRSMVSRTDYFHVFDYWTWE